MGNYTLLVESVLLRNSSLRFLLVHPMVCSLSRSYRKGALSRRITTPLYPPLEAIGRGTLGILGTLIRPL